MRAGDHCRCRLHRRRGRLGVRRGRSDGELRLERSPELARGREAVVALFAQAARDDRRESVRDALRQRSLIAHDARDGVGRGVALKRTPSRHGLVHHRAEGEEVAAAIDRFPERLLGRHVKDRADDRPLLREHGRRIVRVHVLRLDLFRDAEVEHLHARTADHDVVRLDVAVHDPLFVRRLQRIRHAARDPAHIRLGHRSAPDHM
jgi:hypothetical protein